VRKKSSGISRGRGCGPRGPEHRLERRPGRRESIKKKKEGEKGNEKAPRPRERRRAPSLKKNVNIKVLLGKREGGSPKKMTGLTPLNRWKKTKCPPKKKDRHNSRLRKDLGQLVKGKTPPGGKKPPISPPEGKEAPLPAKKRGKSRAKNLSTNNEKKSLESKRKGEKTGGCD